MPQFNRPAENLSNNPMFKTAPVSSIIEPAGRGVTSNIQTLQPIQLNPQPRIPRINQVNQTSRMNQTSPTNQTIAPLENKSMITRILSNKYILMAALLIPVLLTSSNFSTPNPASGKSNVAKVSI